MNILVVTGQRTEKFAEPLKQVNKNTHIVSVDSSSLLRRGVNVIFSCHKLLSKHDIDVVVGDHAGISSFVGSLMAAIHKKPFLLRLGGNIWKINSEKVSENWNDRAYENLTVSVIITILNKMMFSLTSGYLAISKTVSDSIVENKSIEPEKISRIGVPVDLKKFNRTLKRSELGHLNLEDNSNLIITVTNLRFRDKYIALRDSLPQIADLLEQNEHTHFAIAGDGKYSESITEDIDNTFPDASRKRVHHLGYVNDVESLYCQADATVYFSYSEGFGNAIQEAMAAGCPVVANDCEGLAEQIENGKTGWLVKTPKNKELIDILTKILNEDGLSNNITRRALERVRKISNNTTVGYSILCAIKSQVRKHNND